MMNRKIFLGVVLITCVLLGSLSGVVQTQAPTKAQIAFSSDRDGNSEIYVMDVDGKNIRRLTDHPAADFSPTWSPDGRRIAFSSQWDGKSGLYVMDADGNNLRNLTKHPAQDVSADWFNPTMLPVVSNGKRATTWGWIKQISK